MEDYKSNMLRYLQLLADRQVLSDKISVLVAKLRHWDYDYSISHYKDLYIERYKFRRDLWSSQCRQFWEKEKRLTREIFEVSSRITPPPKQQKRVTFLIPGTSQFNQLFSELEK